MKTGKADERNQNDRNVILNLDTLDSQGNNRKVKVRDPRQHKSHNN